VYSPSEIYLEGFVELVVRHGLKTLVLIGEDSLFPQAAVKGALELARKRGLRVVLTEATPEMFRRPWRTARSSWPGSAGSRSS
jgi:uncharacterized LabA/DUF88 family protein